MITTQDSKLNALQKQMAEFDKQTKKASGELLVYMMERVDAEMRKRAAE